MKKILTFIVVTLMSVSFAFAADVKTNTKVVKEPVQKQVSSVKKETKKVKKKVKKVKEAKSAEVKPVEVKK